MGRDSYSRIDALLVGYERQENLGLRSIAAYLRERGLQVELLAFEQESFESIHERVRRTHPRIVGFSIIFQYSLDEFADLSGFLRSAGVRAHFTAGGHFPSLRPQQTLDLMPALDSIVRFEGEATLFELVSVADRPDCWRSVRGLAYRSGREVILTKPRSLIADLDRLPPVLRDTPREGPRGIRMASMLASRGCLFNCAFCSIRQFYGNAQGDLRRARSPGAVVEEMRRLFQESNVRYFSFQDDDFACRTRDQRRWLQAFLDTLDSHHLGGHIRWKISCRVDDIDAQLVERMIRQGLIAVYLGVESGNPLGLRTLQKKTTVAQNLSAISMLKSAGIALAVGFMLFDPSSTIETVRENLDFLMAIGSDGYFSLNFCKMLPYAGTPIEEALRVAGRLTGTPSRPDYRFLDRRLDDLELLVQKVFSARNFGDEGIVALLQQADLDLRMEAALGDAEGVNGRMQALREIVKESNLTAVGTLSSLLDLIVQTGLDAVVAESGPLMQIVEKEWRAEAVAEIALRKLCLSTREWRMQ